MSPENKAIIVEAFGKHYTPKILRLFSEQGIVADSGKPFSGAHLRNILLGNPYNPSIESQMLRLALDELRGREALNAEVKTYLKKSRKQSAA